MKGQRRYACGEACRAQVLAEAGGARLGAFMGPVTGNANASANVNANANAAPLPSAAPAKASSPPTAVPRVRKEIQGPRRLAIFNHKGGTGKTTTTVSIAA